MRIIYKTIENPASNSCSGVERKLHRQISCLKNLGIEIIPIYIINNNRYLRYLANFILGPLKLLHNSRYKKDSERTIIYIRRALGSIYYLPYFPLIFGDRKYKIVFEVQDIERKLLQHSLKSRDKLYVKAIIYFQYIETLLFEKVIKRNIDGIVSVTSEITEYNKYITNNAIKYLTLGNGIDVQSLPIKHCLPIKDGILHVLCVARVSAWHGLDRFILGLASYTGSREIYLHIVGNGPEIPHLKELTEMYNLSTKVVFHGFKSGVELDEMFDMCQIALGSLAGFRISMLEMSSLKNGEYCARGIPFIIAAKVMDFPEDWPYIKHIACDETPVNMEEVISFADAIIADSSHSQTMRKYAEEYLSWDSKMKKLKDFLESL